MKKMFLSLLSVAAAVSLSGCFAVHTNDATAVVKVDVKSHEFKADIAVGNTPVSGEATVHNLFGLISWGVSSYADDAFCSTSTLPIQMILPATTVAKQGAAYNACAEAKADVLLAAKYKLDINDYIVYKAIKCKVTGYPGSIKGVK